MLACGESSALTQVEPCNGVGLMLKSIHTGHSYVISIYPIGYSLYLGRCI